MLAIQKHLILPGPDEPNSVSSNTQYPEPRGLSQLGPAIVYGVLDLPNLTENGNWNVMA